MLRTDGRSADGRTDVKTVYPPYNFVIAGGIMTGNNPKVDVVNVDVHTKFGQILSICS